MWTLDEAVGFARQLEVTISRTYRHYHVAVGGSVLHAGQSQKDLDIFIYPHKTRQEDRKYLEIRMAKFGIEFIRDCDHHIYGDGKEVIEGKWNGKRIDFFFLK